MHKLLKSIGIAFALTLAITSCDSYDDTELSGRVDDLESRVTELEKKVQDLNTNVQSLSTAIRALENEDRIQAVNNVTDEEGNIIGYEIVLSNSGTMTILNGEKPFLSVKLDEDGVYYWTVDGEYLLNGTEKIPATIAPEFKVENGSFWFRVNGGEWTAVAGSDSGIGLIKEIIEDETSVTFVLSEGDPIVISKVQDFSLTLGNMEVGIMPYQAVSISYSVTSGDDATVVKAISEGGFTVEVDGNSESGTITIIAPEQIPSNASVIVFAINSNGAMTGRIISIEEGVLSLLENTVTVGKDAEQIAIRVRTNMDYEVMVDPSNIWITEVPATKAVRTDEILFNVEAYDGSAGESRTGLIHILYGDGMIETFTVTQLNATVIKGGRADFETFNASGNAITYVPSGTKTNAGWYVNEYCLVIPQATTRWDAVNGMIPFICGFKDEPGSLSSPTLEGGCGTLTIKHGTHIGAAQNVGYSFKVTVSNGSETKETTIAKASEEATQYTVLEDVIEINLSGNFTVTMTNLCAGDYAPIRQKIKAAAGILAVEWTGYSE